MQKLPLGLAGSGLVLLVFAIIVGWVVVPNVIDDQIAKVSQAILRVKYSVRTDHYGSIKIKAL